MEERKKRIAEAMRDLWEEIADDIIAARQTTEISRIELVEIMGDFYVSHNYDTPDGKYFLNLINREEIFEMAFPSKYKTWGN